MNHQVREGVAQANLGPGPGILVNRCARIRDGEKVVIVADHGKLLIARALFEAVVAARGVPVLIEMQPRSVDAEEPPEPVARAMAAADVIFTPVTLSITNTRAVSEALARGARVLVLSAFTEDMMRSEALNVDFGEIAVLCRALARRLEHGDVVRVCSHAGSDFRAVITGRRGNAVTGVPLPGEFAAVPTIEANVSPLEGTSEGVIVADGSIPYLGIGVLRDAVRLEIAGGVVVGVSGGQEAKRFEDALGASGDPNSYNIAEIGIGLNPKARLTGILLEDEGVYGSVHIGIGTSLILGGSVKAATHYDVVLKTPTVEVDGETVLESGEFVPSLLGS